jgi:Transcriptional regulator, AbiEi antitoxin
MRGELRTHQGLAELAANQHGVVSCRQLERLGYSDDAILRQALAGRLHKLHRGIYAVGHRAITHHGEALAAVLAVGDGGLLSHRSAAGLWGLTKRWQRPVEVTAAAPRRTRLTLRVHSAVALTAEDRSAFEGIAVTAVPRTLLDFAASDPHFLGRALDNAERRGLLDLEAINALLARSAGFRGARRLRMALAPFRLPAFTRSGLERRFLALVREAGLPLPSINHFVAGYELDAYWQAERFAVELDTYDYHGGHAAFEEDRVRQETLKLAGIEMIRLTGSRVEREPEAVAERLSRLLAQRRAELSPRHPH